jgi:hypothetical protein
LALFLWTTAWLLLTLALASTAALARALAPPVRSLLNNLVQPAAQTMRNEERAFREARSFLCIFCLFFAYFPIFKPRDTVNTPRFLPFSHTSFTNFRDLRKKYCIQNPAVVKSEKIAFAI